VTVDGRRLVSRPRLLTLLDRAVEQPLTVICAPPGSGVRTLLRQWEDHRAGAGGRPIVRRSPPSDGSTTGWSRGALEAALDDGEAIAIIDGLEPMAHREAVDWLRGEVAAGTRPRHVIVRSSVRWPTRSVERTRGLSTVLTRADLRFTPQEGQEFVAMLAGEAAAAAAGPQLVDRCMGWAAALRIAASGAARSSDPMAHLENYHCDDPYLVAFVEQEILAPLTAKVARFLVRSSVLERLSPALCDATTGQRDSAVMVRLLHRKELFIDRVGPALPGAVDQPQYVVEPAFRDLLLQVLRRREPATERDLRTRAAHWLEANGKPGQAAEQLRQAGSWDDLIDLMDRHGTGFYERRQGSELLRWLEAVPYGSDHPRGNEMQVRRAAVLTMLGRTRQAAHLLGELERDRLTRGERVLADVVRTTWGYFHESPDAVIRSAESVLEGLAELAPASPPNLFGILSPHDMACMAAIQRARALWYAGDVSASDTAVTPLLGVADVYAPWRVHLLGHAALLRAWTGDLVVAEQRATEGLAVARRAGFLRHSASLDARLALACLARERGDVGRAQRAQRAAIDAGDLNRPIVMLLCTLESCLLDLAMGRPEKGLEQLLAVNPASAYTPPHGLADRLRAAEVRLSLAVGDLGRAQWLVAQSGAAPFLQGPAVHCDVLAHDLPSARRRLTEWQPAPIERREQVEHGLWSAHLEFVTGSRRRALKTATAALSMAERHGLERVVLDVGEPFLRLLRSLTRTAPSPFVGQLLSRSSAPTTGYRTLGLSEREVEILSRLPSPVSNDEIAEQLFISVNTLKTHLRAIYRKLGVHSRREAVQRAEVLGGL
jgi:LuxR family transcriptional regulator, maltose regulon positive regulatory protein